MLIDKGEATSTWMPEAEIEPKKVVAIDSH